MYLEISPRQSSKSTRLMNHAVETYNAGHGFLIFCVNQEMKKLVQKKIDESISLKWPNILRGVYSARSFDIMDLSSFDLSDCRMYFDEFDFFETEFWHEIKNILYLERCYFCTTPRYLRDISILNKRKSGVWLDDMITFLLIENDWNFIKEESRIDLSTLKNSLSSKEYYTEALGSFIKI